MPDDTLDQIASALVADGKGILAADESVATLTRRFEALGIQSTEQSRRQYREMLFTTPGVAAFISGVILYDETIRQKASTGTPLGQVLERQGMVPGIKVDTGARPLAGAPGELITEGLDGLRDRLAEYRGMGARFAKWRAVIDISDVLPPARCVSPNAHALARYAALCQEVGRALQDQALEGWRGRDENVTAGQQALYRRSRCNRAASLGIFTGGMEAEAAFTSAAPARS